MNNIDNIIKDMDSKEEKERVVNGIKIERYRPSAIESLESMGRGFKVKERLEKERELRGKRKANPTQWKKAMENWQSIVNFYEKGE
jgi:hypothetical protein